MKEKEVVEENEEEEEGIRKFCDTTYIHHKQTNTGRSENREHPPVQLIIYESSVGNLWSTYGWLYASLVWLLYLPWQMCQMYMNIYFSCLFVCVTLCFLIFFLSIYIWVWR